MKRYALLAGALLTCGVAVAGYQNLRGDGVSSRLVPFYNTGVQFDRDEIDFGTITVGTETSTSVVVTNPGDEALTLQPVSAEGAFAAQQGEVVLEPGGAAMLSFRFAPKQAGLHELKVSLRSERGFAGALTLTGEASAPPEISIEPRTLDFGPVVVGEERVTPLRLVNRGAGRLRIESLAGVGRFHFSAKTLELDAGESMVVHASFAPDRLGPRRAQLLIRSNDPIRGDAAVEVRGEGVDQALAPAIAVSPATLDFGSVAPGHTVRRYVEIRNLSKDPLVITSVLVDGPFRIANRSRRIAPRGMVRLPITLIPQQGERQVLGSVAIHSNDPDDASLVLVAEAEITDDGVRGEAIAAGGSGGSAETGGSGGLIGSLIDSILGRTEPDASSASGDAAVDGGRAASADPEDGDATARPSGGFEVEDGSYLNLASYRESVGNANFDRARYDSSAGTVTLEGFQLPVVDAALGEYFSFSKTDVTATVSDTGEVSAVVPLQIIDEFGNQTTVDVTLTTDTATAMIDGTEVSMAGAPLSGGAMTLVGLERVPGGALEGHSLQLNLNVRVE